LSTAASVSSCGVFVKYYFSAVCSVIITIHSLHIFKEIVIKVLFEAVHNKRRKKLSEGNPIIMMKKEKTFTMAKITTMRGSEKEELEGKCSATRRRKQIYKSEKCKKLLKKSVTESKNMKRLPEGEFLRGRRGDVMTVTENEIRTTEGVHWYTGQMLETSELLRCTL
jgi:hypothetical protein